MFHQVLRLQIDRGKVPSERMVAYVGLLSLLLLSTASGSHPLSFFSQSLCSHNKFTLYFVQHRRFATHTWYTRCPNVFFNMPTFIMCMCMCVCTWQLLQRIPASLQNVLRWESFIFRTDNIKSTYVFVTLDVRSCSVVTVSVSVYKYVHQCVCPYVCMWVCVCVHACVYIKVLTSLQEGEAICSAPSNTRTQTPTHTHQSTWCTNWKQKWWAFHPGPELICVN